MIHAGVLTVGIVRPIRHPCRVGGKRCCVAAQCRTGSMRARVTWMIHIGMTGARTMRGMNARGNG
jgi:hypothetical protein